MGAMKRDLPAALLALWGMALVCLAILDAAGYQRFWLSLGWW